MLGLGETDTEVLQTLEDLRAHQVDIVTLGQYMRPTKNHLPVDRWVTPEEFAELRQQGLAMGFTEVAAGRYTFKLSTDQVFAGNNLGLGTIPIKQIG